MLLVVGSMCVYMCGSRYITLKYKQYYTINFLVCVSIYSLCPNSGYLCGELLKK